ncbi:MAG: ribonuclease H-like domain-containing protein [Lachnospiraceae bacterium]|nr:ribonuclease H-like domain-containing protein [Lachnospiraceae bacterium]
MIHICKDYQYEIDEYSRDYINSKSLMYDIETTGFSRQHCTVYLIGCAYYHDNTITIEQFFAENPEDEINVLEAFTSMLAKFNTVITFNGLAFDEPFINDRCKLHEIDFKKPAHHIDLFRICTSVKNILNLPAYNQKSIESFLGINRDDQYNGGQLIDIYIDYILNPTDDKLDLLLLHNHDDVKGMSDLIPIISYRDFVNKMSSVNDFKLVEETNFQGEAIKELVLSINLDIALPNPINFKVNDAYINIKDNVLKCLIPLYEGELKYFIKDFKKYYYLPEEDICILREMATSIPSTRKVKAKASTCFIKQTGLFLPVSSYFQVSDDLYSFYETIAKTRRYLTFREDYDAEFWIAYVKDLLSLVM